MTGKQWVRERRAQTPDMDQLLWAHEVANILGVGRNRAYVLMSSGEIPSVRIGRSVRARRQTLDAWIAEQEQAARPVERNSGKAA